MAKNKNFFSYVIPSLLAFALSGVYTIVDGFFIGRRLGDVGIASITIGWPVAAFVQAVGTGIGLAGAIRYSVLDAQNEERRRDDCFAISSLLMIAVSVLFSALFFFLAKPILIVLGAQGEILRCAEEYVKVIALGSILQLLSTGFTPFMRNMGGASWAMIAMILGFITNIVLDYLLVFAANLGIFGAAGATLIGQAVTIVVAIVFFAVKKCKLRIHDKKSAFCSARRNPRTKTSRSICRFI